MALSDDARVAASESIATRYDDDNLGTASAKYALAAVLPDGRTITQALDDGDVAMTVLMVLVSTNRIRSGDGPWMQHSPADELIARLEAEGR